MIATRTTAAAACPVCGDLRPRRLVERFPGGCFAECGGCGIHFAESGRTDLRAYYREVWSGDNCGLEPYAEKVEAAQDAARLERLLATVPRFRWALAQARRLPRGARVLDAGCGEGALLWGLQRLGLEPHGCDLAPPAVALARRLLGSAEVHVGRIGDLPYAPRSFDCVIGLELLEHLPNPAPFLEQASQLLEPHGRLLLTMPNRHRLFAVLKRLLGRPHSSTDYPPHHYTRWSAAVLGRLLGRYFRRVQVGSLPYYFGHPAARALAVPLHLLTASRMGQSLCASASEVR